MSNDELPTQAAVLAALGEAPPGTINLGTEINCAAKLAVDN